ncbi:MAG: serine/threonine protein kinase, partial [Chromatiales bacterium]|nr:serine/threonine protein kinase [Chromatiales bacterium]
MNQLGRYQLGEVIGEGAMSRVYRAYDPKLQRTLAIKVLKPEFASDKERLRLFLSEVHISGKLNHSNIVSVFDVGEVDNVPFIVMEYVDCQSLDEWMKEQDKLDMDQIVDIVLQVAYALEYAHSKGIIHRDIKPSNILIEPSGKIHLTDFGVAYLQEHGEDSPHQAIVGTPFYMAPEQLAGEIPDARSDLYSCGVLFYQLVFSVLPYEASSVRELMELIQKSDIDLSTAHCSHAIKKVIRRLLHKKPSFRYPNATELIKQLKGLQTELSTVDSRLSEKVASSWRYTAIIATAVSVLLLTFLIFSLNDLSNSLSGVLSSYGKMLVHQTKEQVDEALLLDDNLALTVIVENVSGEEDVEYLHVTDSNGVIRASSQKDQVGEEYRPVLNLQRIEHTADFDIFLLQKDNAKGEPIYHMTSSILFNDKEIGKVIVGLSAGAITQVWSRAAWALSIFIFVTCLVITLVIYFLSRFFTKQFSQLGDALKGLYVGNYYIRLHV